MNFLSCSTMTTRNIFNFKCIQAISMLKFEFHSFERKLFSIQVQVFRLSCGWTTTMTTVRSSVWNTKTKRFWIQKLHHKFTKLSQDASSQRTNCVRTRVVFYSFLFFSFLFIPTLLLARSCSYLLSVCFVCVAFPTKGMSQMPGHCVDC